VRAFPNGFSTPKSKLNIGLNAMTSVFEATNKSIRPEAQV